jgi:CheY-like chemotaxis protein
VGKGTTFKIYLPRVDEGAVAYKTDAAATDIPRGSETILLAEDADIVRSLAKEILEVSGYRVLEAPNGGAALLICENHPAPIDLLLTDVVMPEMNGRDLAKRLLHLHPEMRVLYMSGYTPDAIVRHGVLEEGTHFIEKPFGPSALAIKVREVLEAPSNGDNLKTR